MANRRGGKERKISNEYTWDLNGQNKI